MLFRAAEGEDGWHILRSFPSELDNSSGYLSFFFFLCPVSEASQVVLLVKNLPAKAGDAGSILGWEDSWRRARQPTPVFLPGEFHGQRNLTSYSPWGCKELDMTEHTHAQHRNPFWKKNIYIWDKYIREFISHCVSLASKVPLQEAEIASTVFQPVLQLTYGHMAEAWPIWS